MRASLTGSCKHFSCVLVFEPGAISPVGFPTGRCQWSVPDWAQTIFPDSGFPVSGSGARE